MSSSPHSSTTTRSPSGCTRTSNGAALGENVVRRVDLGPRLDRAVSEQGTIHPPTSRTPVAAARGQAVARRLGAGPGWPTYETSGDEVIASRSPAHRSFRAAGVRSGIVSD